MSLDLHSFIQFAGNAGGKASIALHLPEPGAAGPEALSLQRTSALGRLVAAIKGAFAGPSAAETRATQAFIAAVRQEFGSTGVNLLRAEGITEQTALRARQVQHIQQRLQGNAQDGEIGELKRMAPVRQGAAHSNFTQIEAVNFPVIDAANAAISRHNETATDLVHQANRHFTHMTPAQAALVDVALIVSAGNTGSASELLAIESFRQSYEKRLDLSSGIDHNEFSVKTSRIEGRQVDAAAVLNELIHDQLEALRAEINKARAA